MESPPKVLVFTPENGWIPSFVQVCYLGRIPLDKLSRDERIEVLVQARNALSEEIAAFDDPMPL